MTSTEVKAVLANIRNVEVRSRVVVVRDIGAKIVTAVKFEYDGEPSAVNDILQAEASGIPVNASLYSEQLAFDMDKEGE